MRSMTAEARREDIDRKNADLLRAVERVGGILPHLHMPLPIGLETGDAQLYRLKVEYHQRN